MTVTLTEQIQAVEKEIVRLKHVMRRQERNGAPKAHATAAQLNSMQAAAKTLRNVDSGNAAERSISEALNSGDGSYRP